MNLSSANVDLDGCIVATGRLEFPSDDNGTFQPSGSNRIRISRHGYGTIESCSSANRTPSGFLKAQGEGPSITIPAELARAIFDALRSPPGTPLREVYSRDGVLGPAGNSSFSKFQYLSDWRFAAERKSNGVHFDVSAALRSDGNSRMWANWAEFSNQWSDSNARLAISFHVDDVTRIACFGGYTTDIDELYATPQKSCSVEHTSLAALKLSSAPVGYGIDTYAISGDDGWVGIYDSRFQDAEAFPSLWLTLSQSPNRLPNGFLSPSYAGSPQIRIAGFSIMQSYYLLAAGSEMRQEILLGPVGEIIWNDAKGSRDPISSARIVVHLKADGLIIEYSLICKNSESGSALLNGAIIVPWELLILRYPAFLNLRERLA